MLERSGVNNGWLLMRRAEKRSAFRRMSMLDSVIPGEDPGSMGA